MEKRCFRFFSAGVPAKNAADLDRHSQEGWALEKAGLLLCTFRQDTVVWRYRLDFNPTPQGTEGAENRKSLWNAAGWEEVSALPTGWVYYRKAWDPAQPEAVYDPPVDYTAAQWKAAARITQLFWLQGLLLAVGVVLAALSVIRQKAMMPVAVVFLAAVLIIYFRMQALQKTLQ